MPSGDPNRFKGKDFKAFPERINRNGRPKGSLNRKTMAREVLQTIAVYPDEAYEKAQQLFPGISREMSIHKMKLFVQAWKAIVNGDTTAARFLSDEAFGKQAQEEETTIQQPVMIQVNLGDTQNNIQLISDDIE